MKPDRVVIGTSSPRGDGALRTLYEPFTRNRDRMIVMDVRSAELTKYAANAMLATKISFMNELANLAEACGADIESVRIGIGSDPRIGHGVHLSGRRLWRLLFSQGRQGAASAPRQEVGYRESILAAVEAVNERQKTVLFQKDQGAISATFAARPSRSGACVQTQHRRHARGAEPRADGGALGRRARGARL